MKHIVIAALLAGQFITLSAAEILNPVHIRDWEGYALNFFLKETQGVITTKKHHVVVSTKNILKIDPKAVYELSGQFRLLKAGKNQGLYFGLIPCNAKGERILPQAVNPIRGSETVLTRPAKAGSKIFFVKDASKWQKTSWRNVAFDVKNNYADLPNTNVSEFIVSIDKDQAGADWRITLRSPLKKNWKQGTAVRQHHSSSKQYLKSVLTGKEIIPTQWTTFKNTISGSLPIGVQEHGKFWYGTDGVRIYIEADLDLEFKDIKLVRK